MSRWSRLGLLAAALLVGVVPAAAATQTPTISFSPVSGSWSPGAQVAVTIEWCAPAGIFDGPGAVTFNGVDVSGQFPFQSGSQGGCTDYATSQGTVMIAAGQNTLHAAIYSTQGFGENTATYTGIAPMSVSVTPDGQATPNRPANTAGFTAQFTVTNTGEGTDTYSFSCTGTGVTCTNRSPTSAQLAPSASVVVTATYTTGGLGTGKLNLLASGSANDTAWFNVPIVMAVAVTPDGGTAAWRPVGAADSVMFTVQNTGTASDTYAMVCSGQGISCTSVSPASAVIAASQSSAVTVRYTVTGSGVSPGGTATARLTANGIAADSGHYAVPVARVSVSALTAFAAHFALQGPFVDSFTVSNLGSLPETFALSCWGLSLPCAVSSGPITLYPNMTQKVFASYSTEAPGLTSLEFRAAGSLSADTGAGTVDIATPGPAPQLPGPAIVVLPPSHTRADATLRVVIDWCGYWPNLYTLGSHVIRLNGVDVTAQFQTAPLFQNSCRNQENQGDDIGERSIGIIQLVPGANILEGVVFVGPAGYSGVATYTLVGGAGPDVRVTAASQYTEARQGSNSQSFMVRNIGGASGGFAVAHSCSGSVTGCSVSPASPTIGAGDSASVTVSYTAGAAGTSGRIWLQATVPDGAGGTRRDSVYTDVVALAASAPGVAVVKTLGVLERDLCVTIASGDGAAYECGDLRLVHGLPVTRTRNTPRAPTLIYNSQHASPFPLVSADITLPAGVAASDTVIVRVVRGSVADTARWAASQWQSGWANRVTMPVLQATGWATGFYGYIMEVRTKAGVLVGSDSGQLAIVARSSSRFGAGWWLAGLESLNPTTKVWTGGDGSMRAYAASGTNVWLAAAVDRPDTLTWNASASRYIRHLRNGLQVRFDNLGRHRETINRLGQVTSFHYNSSSGTRLDSLRLPPASAAQVYRLYYDAAGKIDSIVGPPIGATTRVTQLTVTSGRLLSIRDPDLTTVSFTHGSGVTANRVIRRTDRRGYTTRFAYDAAKRLSRDSIELAAATWAVTTIAAAETRGYATAGAPGVSWRSDTVYTDLNGPRTDVADVTRFWPNAYGAPRRIRNALGEESRVEYSATWPALATRTIAPNGFETQAAYHPTRGLVTSTTAVDPLGAGVNATTSYAWHAKWDMAIRVQSPTGLVDSVAYDTNTGNRLWQGRGAQTASFTYHPSGPGAGLIATTTVAGLPPESYFYSALDNLSRTRTPIGFTSVVYADAIGRDTLAFSPIDSLTGLDSAAVVTNGSRARTRYDVMGRVIETVSWGPQRSVTGSPPRTLPADSVRVVNLYDAEGNDTLTTRYVPKPGGFLALQSRWAFDRANRVTEEQSVGISSRSFVLDAAGNVTAATTARGLTITTAYDALGRVTEQFVPPVSYGYVSCTQYFVNCFYTLPVGASAVCARADTARFGYDHAGNVVRADNWAARVRRGFTPSGLLARDTLVVRTYYPEVEQVCEPAGGWGATAGWSQHVYALAYGYDLEGRRTALVHPDGIDACAGQCAQQYLYHPTTGQLDSLVDVLGHAHRFAYDNAGRPIARVGPGGWTDSTGYDADSRVVRRRVGTYSTDVLAYDAASRVIGGLITNHVSGYPQSVGLNYSGLGAVAYATGLTFQSSFEEFETDAIGNRRWHRDQNMTPGYQDRRRVFTYDAQGRHQFVQDSAPPNGWAYGYWSNYDASGNVSATYGYEAEANVATIWLRLSYYGADERLRAHTTHKDSSYWSGAGGVFEEYRYDALGRRVLVRSRQTDVCSQPQTSSCGNIERTVWDGDQVLYEIRARGGTGATSAQLENDFDAGEELAGNRWGRVLYQHAGGIDVPVNIIRMGMEGQPAVVAVSPHTNWQGDFEIGSLMDGSPTTNCGPGQSGCPVISFPGGRMTADGAPGSLPPSGWFGNLISGKLDGSGLQYMRNRYYDPQTGRFTQQDPIGLAGGLNLYGFANGDPVNFSDPFGLKVGLPASERIRSALRQLAAGSETFQRMFSAMYRASSSEINVSIEGCSDGRSLCQAANREGGFTFNRGAFPIMVVAEVDDRVHEGDALMERVAHELVEAAAAYGSRGLALAGLSCDAGESNHNCATRWQNQMMDQVRSSREGPKGESGGKQ